MYPGFVKGEHKSVSHGPKNEFVQPMLLCYIRSRANVHHTGSNASFLMGKPNQNMGGSLEPTENSNRILEGNPTSRGP